MAIDYNICRLAKRNQVLRMVRGGVSVALSDVIKYRIKEYDDGTYEVIGYPMIEDTRSTREHKGRGIDMKRFDELNIYEHPTNFNAYHQRLSDLHRRDPIRITQELSSGYYLRDEEGTIVQMYIFFYFLDLMFLDENTKSKKTSETTEGKLIDAILKYIIKTLENTDDFYSVEIKIITNSEKNSDTIIKSVEPTLNKAPDVDISHVPITSMMVSAASHVLNPIIREASSETVEAIKTALKSDDSVFGKINLTDPLIIDYQLPEGTIIEIDKPDKYRYYRKIGKGVILREKIS